MCRGTTFSRYLIVATVGLSLLSLAPPARAKLFSVGSLRISGPTLERPIYVKSRPLIPNNQSDHRIYLTTELLGKFHPLEDSTGWGSLVFGKYGMRQPSDRLGPRFVLVYVLDFYVDRAEHVPLVLHVYPFAPGGPVAFTPTGQTIPHFEGGRTPVPAGWQTYSRKALGVLRELGLPEKAPSLRRSGDSSADSSLPTGTQGPGGIGIAFLVAALAVFTIKRRTRPSPA